MADSPVLDGIRVIDFGQYIAGPVTAMLLADQGADVIRVDPPGGPRYDTPANATWNRGKRSIVLDLKKPADADTARKLIETADVLVENFRPGVMDRLGLGPAAMTRSNPRLIYCSLPGFGRDDPRAGLRAWEGVLAAATCGFNQRTDVPRVRPPIGHPVYSPIPFSSMFGAFLATVSVTMALNARELSGLGQRIEVPLFDATFSTIGAMGMKAHNAPPAKSKLNWSRQLQTKDGRWFMYLYLNKHHEEFIREIGMARHRDAGANAEELRRRFDEVFRTRTAEEWELLCDRIGTEGVTCHTSAEWMGHPQALGSKIIDEYTDPQLGRFRGPGITPRLLGTPGRVRSPRPRPDAHREEILKELSTSRRRPLPRR